MPEILNDAEIEKINNHLLEAMECYAHTQKGVCHPDTEKLLMHRWVGQMTEIPDLIHTIREERKQKAEAIKEIQDKVSDYPYEHNDLREAVLAITCSLEGTDMAVDDLHEEISNLKKQKARIVEAGNKVLNNILYGDPTTEQKFKCDNAICEFRAIIKAIAKAGEVE